jgi:hypothetical protein
MNKTPVSFLFNFLSVGGTIVMAVSMGWLLVFLGILILPAVILHFVAGRKALKRHPQLNPHLLTSSLLFAIFALIRTDGDDVSSYSGFSSLLYHLGLRSGRDADPPGYMLTISIIILLIVIILDYLLLKKAKKPLEEYSDML